MELMECAASVLAQYGLDGAPLAFLRHNENAVYRVGAPEGSAYVLRLHLPGPGLCAGALSHRREWLESELAFLHALHERGGVAVQRPVPARDGSLLTPIPGGGGYASLLSWLPGAAFDQKAGNSREHARAAGALAATLHGFVLSWPESEALPRPSYDAARVESAARALEDGPSLGLYSDSLLRELKEAAALIAAETDRLNRAPGAHGLIHADLGLGNLIVHGETVSPIDFGLCGHGPFLLDLGGLMGTFDLPPLRQAALDGYAELRPLRADGLRSVEAFFLLSVLLFMALHLRNGRVRAWFGRRLPVFVRDYVHPFAQGDPFLHTLLREG